MGQKRPAGPPSHENILRGAYGQYRANNKLISYDLDIRVDPKEKFISGKNTITFRMLKEDTRIQLDLTEVLNVDKIVLGKVELKTTRDSGAVFVDFPKPLRAGKVYAIDFYYSGRPRQGGLGGISFDKDPSGHDWITTFCEGLGASLWWPNKDQWKDKVEEMRISVAVPSNLVEVSNGRFLGKRELGDGFTRWNWKVDYPINNYCVSVNAGNYRQFADRSGSMALSFYALPEHLEGAKKQFAQCKGMIEAYQHYFGEYPFRKDGYKLIDVPYAGMEHQSAVTYGNGFMNGYYGSDWTGVGISPRFDFIIIHESGHEWFGNAVSAQDISDMWIHEGWTTYLEGLYVEYRWGKADGLKYVNGYKSKVANTDPIISHRGENAASTQDMYFKGALFLNTLRSVVNDDKVWFSLIHDLYQRFKYHAIMTEDIVAFFTERMHTDMKPIFDQYLRHGKLVTLELRFGDGAIDYRWIAEEPGFNMPIQVGENGDWRWIHPTTAWQSMKSNLTKDSIKVAADRFYVNVAKE